MHGALHLRGQFIDVGHGAPAGDQAEAQLPHVALHRDVQRHAVNDDGQGEHARHLRPRQVQRHLRPGHVGDGDIGQAQPVGETGATVQRRQPAEQPGRAQGRKVLGDEAAEAAHLLLHCARAGHDGLQALERVFELRGQVDHGARDLVVAARVAFRAQRDRHTGDQCLLRQFARVSQVRAQGCAAQPQHHVIHGSPQRLADRLDLLQRQCHAGKGALIGDGRVEGRRGRQFEPRSCGAGLVAYTTRGERAFRGAKGRAGQGRQQLGELHELLQLVAQSRAQQFCHAELVAVGACRARRPHAPRFGRHVEHAVAHGDRSLAIDRRMVHLGIEAQAAVGQAFDDVELPQRAAAVEPAGMQSCCKRFQLRHAAGLGQHEVPDVIVQVDVVVSNPDRVGQFERHQCKLAREHRGEVHAARDMRLDGLEPRPLAARGGLEQRQAAHVHGHFRAFQVQEGAVDDAQVVHVVHRLSPSVLRALAPG